MDDYITVLDDKLKKYELTSTLSFYDNVNVRLIDIRDGSLERSYNDVDVTIDNDADLICIYDYDKDIVYITNFDLLALDNYELVLTDGAELTCQEKVSRIYKKQNKNVKHISAGSRILNNKDLNYFKGEK